MTTATEHDAALFMDRPHDRLYGAVWDDNEQMRPQARAAFRDSLLDLVTNVHFDARDWIRFAVIGSGASYNWDEAGDIDIQVWVADPDRVGDVRRVIVRNLLGATCRDLGLIEPPGDGSMEVQWYAKPGKGTPQDNLDTRPYACYDLDLDTWLVPPYPLTPEMYGDQFAQVEGQASEIAAEGEALLAAHDRAIKSVEYWSELAAHAGPGSIYIANETHAGTRAAEARADLKAFYTQLVEMRARAYKPGGLGIHDERDSIWKLLQVWGLLDPIKAVI